MNTDYPNPPDKPPAETYADLRHTDGWVLRDPGKPNREIKTDVLVALEDWR